MNGAAASAGERAPGYLLMVAAILAVPRIARLLYPQVWIEDESYLNGAFMLSRGWLPYRDFPVPHLPLLEAFMASLFRLAPITIRTAEVVTALAALAGSLLVYKIGETCDGRVTGTIAALIYATSGLLFRYHLFEREVFDVVPVLGAVLLLRRRERLWRAGVLLAIAMAVKLTALAAVVAVAVQLVVEHRRRDAAIVAGTAIALVAAASAVLAVWFGPDFLVQVFVFRLAHASFPSLGVKIDEMRYTLDVAFATGVAGAVFLLWTRRARQWLAPLMQLASGFVFLVAINATYWAHTGIELLPWLSLCGGALIAAVAAGARVWDRNDDGAGRSDRRRRATAPRNERIRSTRRFTWRPRPTLAAGLCAAGALVLLVFVSPVRNLNWEAGDGSIHGFGYRDRAELANVSSFVRTHTGDDARVATPPIVAFAANRREVVPYAEVSGDIAELTAAVRRDGYLRAIAGSPLGSQTFWEGLSDARDRIAPIIDEAVRARSAGAVINFSSDDLFPVLLIDVPQQTLEAARYDLAAVTPHYEVWIPRP